MCERESVLKRDRERERERETDRQRDREERQRQRERFFYRLNKWLNNENIYQWNVTVQQLKSIPDQFCSDLCDQDG